MAAPQHDEFLMKHYYGHFIITISKANDDLFSLLQTTTSTQIGCGGGLVVSVLAVLSDKPSLNPAKVYSFCYENVVSKRMTINSNMPRLAHF